MGDQFDIYRGPTGMGLTPHEKGMLDGLAKGPERVVVKHYEAPKEPVLTGTAEYQVGRVEFGPTTGEPPRISRTRCLLCDVFRFVFDAIAWSLLLSISGVGFYAIFGVLKAIFGG